VAVSGSPTGSAGSRTYGYNLEHSFGHGKQHLAALLITLNLLAFAFHTVCDHAEKWWHLARSKVSSRAQFFGNMVAITSYLNLLKLG